MEYREGEILIIAVVLLVILGSFLVLLFLIFLKRKNNILKSKAEAEYHFKQELIKTQVEIREETLRNISWELHDNIGQLMTLAKIQAQNAKDNPDKIEKVADIIGDGLKELRALSKLINPEYIKNLSLFEAVQMEIERFNRLNFIEASIEITNKPNLDLSSKHGVILFRILQEFFSNTIKHSRAEQLKVILDFKAPELLITAKDNGVGFVNRASNKGLGIENMQNRANLIGADLEITSTKNQGTCLKLKYNIKHN